MFYSIPQNLNFRGKLIKILSVCTYSVNLKFFQFLQVASPKRNIYLCAILIIQMQQTDQQKHLHPYLKAGFT